MGSLEMQKYVSLFLSSDLPVKPDIHIGHPAVAGPLSDPHIVSTSLCFFHPVNPIEHTHLTKKGYICQPY